MRFIAIIGEMGGGKTCLATRILKMNHDIGRRVGANYNLKFPSTLISFEELAKFPAEMHHMDFVMDELGTGADSYDFMNETPKNITKLVTQTRKLHNRIYYTVQRFNFIARRLRQLTAGFIFCEDMDSDKDHEAKGFVCGGIFRLSYFNAEGEPTRKPRLFDGRSTWPLYDTDEIIW